MISESADPLRPELPASGSPPPGSPAEVPLPNLTDTPAELRRTMEAALAGDSPNPAEPPVLTPPPPVERPRIVHSFIFHGDAREYFRIWIVNTLLTLLTAGIYSAWAKVRKRRYLRGSTELMGHRFDYRADPRRILAGNILVVLMFIAYMVVGEVYPLVRVGALLIGVVLLPWVVVRSLAFNAHNTTYRGMRFTARHDYGGAMMLFLAQSLVIVVTFGLYYPAWVRNRKQFVIQGHRLGDAFFRFESKSGPFYRAYLVGGAMMFAAALVVGTFTTYFTLSHGGKVPTTAQLLPVLALYGFGLFCAKHYVYAQLFNPIWSQTRLDDHRFEASFSTGAWFKLQLTNLGAIIGTCGLLYPWAVIRSSRYALSCLAFAPQGPVEKISRLSRRTGSAVGETAAEFVGLDIGL